MSRGFTICLAVHSFLLGEKPNKESAAWQNHLAPSSHLPYAPVYIIFLFQKIMSTRQTGLLTSLLLVSFIFIFSNGDNKAGGFRPNFSFCRSLLHFYLAGGGGGEVVCTCRGVHVEFKRQFM